MSSSTKNKRSDQNPSGDDEYLDERIKLNEQCAEETCKKSVKVINIQCNLCSAFFCTTHALPEVHGCGNAARRAASKPRKKPMSKERTAQLENSLSKKLELMRSERKKKMK